VETGGAPGRIIGVFQKEYGALPDLKTNWKRYIAEHKHLPGYSLQEAEAKKGTASMFGGIIRQALLPKRFFFRS